MERLRTRSAALVAALLLIVSVAGVAGANNLTGLSAGGAPQVQAVPGNEDQDEDANENQDEDTNTTEDTDTTEETNTNTPDEAGAQGEHGALVSAAAHLKDCVGGKNHNHGGAVSQVARGEVTEAVCDAAATVATTTVRTKNGKSNDHRKDADHRP